MQLDFNKINNQVIKTLFNDENNNLILTGSYALYNVHLPKINNIKSSTIKIKDVDLDIFKIIKVNTYSYSKILAVTKRFNLLAKGEINKKSNYWKISKDLYDINYILQNSNIDNTKTNENILKMTPNLNINNINKLKQFIKNIILNKTNITNFRGFPIDLDNETYKYKEQFGEKFIEI